HMNANWENFNGDLNADLFRMLRQMLMDVNVLYQFFLTNKEILERQNMEEPLTVRLWLSRLVPRNTNVATDRAGNRQVVDNATRGEVAAVLLNDNDGLPDDG
ncbi:hypothetical protein BpHYR1_018882, partial [Brachionus plicatilis]